MKAIIVAVLLMLSACCHRPPVDVQVLPGKPPAFQIGCRTYHRCTWMAERLCGAAGYRMLRQLRGGVQIFFVPPGFVVDGSWDTVIVIECRFPAPKGK